MYRNNFSLYPVANAAGYFKTVFMFDLKFSYNWNHKLDCDAFSTIRLYNPFKHILGNHCRIYLNNEDRGTGKLVAVHRFLLINLTASMSFIDTGYSVEECRNIFIKMYPKVNFETQQLCFMVVKKDKEVKNGK